MTMRREKKEEENEENFPFVISAINILFSDQKKRSLLGFKSIYLFTMELNDKIKK